MKCVLLRTAPTDLNHNVPLVPANLYHNVLFFAASPISWIWTWSSEMQRCCSTSTAGKLQKMSLKSLNVNLHLCLHPNVPTWPKTFHGAMVDWKERYFSDENEELCRKYRLELVLYWQIWLLWRMEIGHNNLSFIVLLVLSSGITIAR